MKIVLAVGGILITNIDFKTLSKIWSDEYLICLKYCDTMYK